MWFLVKYHLNFSNAMPFVGSSCQTAHRNEPISISFQDYCLRAIWGSLPWSRRFWQTEWYIANSDNRKLCKSNHYNCDYHPNHNTYTTATYNSDPSTTYNTSSNKDRGARPCTRLGTFLPPVSVAEVIETEPFVCVCGCVCLFVSTLTAELFDIWSRNLVQRLTLIISRTSLLVKVIGQRSRSRGKKNDIFRISDLSEQLSSLGLWCDVMTS